MGPDWDSSDWGPYDDEQGYTRPLPYSVRPPRQPYAGRVPRRRRRGRRILKRFAITVLTLVVIAALGIGALWVLTPSASEASQLARQQAQQHGITYPGPQAPATFSNALIATEDHRFYTEQGVDPFAVIRLIESKVTGNTNDQGGATLEQQLAKLLYTPSESGVSAEVKQVVLAYKLDSTYSKSQILDLYAEVAYYGHGYYGLEAASCGYFGHPAADLTPVQGAMLAGVVNAPSIDDPIDYPQQAYARLTHVVDRMVAVGDLTQAQGKQMLNSSLGVVPRSEAGC
jgi:membrane peptidoglycan carboxypeptidase